MKLINMRTVNKYTTMNEKDMILETWLCCNEDGSYVVFNLYEGEFLDYQEHDGNYTWEKITYDKNGVIITHPHAGVRIREGHFATNLQNLEAGEKIRLTD